MKVADLKKELKTRGLSTLGNKNELVDRLQGALIDGGDPLEDTANSEDLLEDDELNDDILEEEEEKQHHEATEEDRILKSPTPSEPSKSESPEQKVEDAPTKELDSEKKEDQSAAPQKKVALKRNISISVSTPVVAATAAVTLSDDEKKQSEEASSDDAKDKDAEAASGEPEKKVIKLTELTPQQRLEMRAKKFGAQATETPDSKLQARAARFGLAAGSSPSKPASTLVSIDALKKRAERFGVNVSDKVTKLEQDEKLHKRQERFGAGAPASTTTAAVVAPNVTATGKVTISSSSTKTDYAERARLRLERFKNTA